MIPRRLLLAGLAAWPGCAAAQPVPLPLPAEATIGRMEPVFLFRGAAPGGVVVTEAGRIFVGFPRDDATTPFTVGELRGDHATPYPDAALNRPDAAHPADALWSVRGLDAAGGLLWLLDAGTPGPEAAPVPGGAKLVAVDLATNKVARTLALPAEAVLPTSRLHDLRVDGADTAYVTDASSRGPGAIVVVDLHTGRALRRLAAHPAAQPDPEFTPVVEAEPLLLRRPHQAPIPWRAAAAGLALSADGATLFFAPLNSRHLFAAPTALLRDPAVDEARLGAAVRFLGEKGAADGMEADGQGRLYAGDVEHDAVRRRDPDGTWTTILHDPRLLWPGALALGPGGWLYVAVSQHERQAAFHDGQDARVRPFVLFRTKVDGTPK